MKKLFSLFLVVLVCGILSPPDKIFSSSPVFEEDFSSNLEKWEFVRDSGNAWSIVDGQLYANILTSFTVSELIPQVSFLPRNLNRYEYFIDIKPISGVDRNVSFGFVSLNTWYELHFIANNQFEVLKLVNSNRAWSKMGSGTLINNQYNNVSIKYDLGKITITLNGSVIFNETDPTYNNESGTIGIKAGTGASYPTRIYFDNIRVYMLDEGTPTPTLTPAPTLTPTPPTNPTATPTLRPTATPTPKPTSTPTPKPTSIPTPTPNLTTTPIPMPHFMQTDPLWADDLYDSANIWSPESDTMADWGCATTSLAMIMRHHQINVMPNGQSITPATLNDWLTDQTDGYLGEGMLNWPAAMRLVRQIHDLRGTTKLEYTRVKSGLISAVANRINNNRPVIANIPGHFLVADQVIGNNQDLRIKDPYYDYTLISQHDSDPISYRAFTPTNTDLSYLVARFDPNINLTVTDPNSNDITDSVLQTEFLQNPQSSTGQTNQAQQILEIPKPTPGIYQLILSSESVDNFQTTIIGYDLLANPDFAELNGELSTEPTIFYLNFTKTGQVEVVDPTSWLSFRLLLNQLHEDGQITQPGLVKVIDRLAAQASLLPPRKQAAAKHIISLLINNIPARFLTESARTSLVTHLSLVNVD